MYKYIRGCLKEFQRENTERRNASNAHSFVILCLLLKHNPHLQKCICSISLRTCIWPRRRTFWIEGFLSQLDRHSRHFDCLSVLSCLSLSNYFGRFSPFDALQCRLHAVSAFFLYFAIFHIRPRKNELLLKHFSSNLRIP